MGKLDYDGRKDLSRKRTLAEEPFISAEFQDQTTDRLPQKPDDRMADTDALFQGLARTYIRGNKIKNGLADMNPAQSIPIEPRADATRAAAIRINPDQSLNGEIITYGMYQTCVDNILRKKWELRGTYLAIKLPASKEEQQAHTVDVMSKSGTGESIIKDFLAEGGIAGTIIMMLCLSPLQTVIFQPLTVEEGAKAVQVAQIPPGIALFLELGIKAERIRNLLKTAKIDNPLVEEQIARLEDNPEARAEALESAGIDYNEFKQSQEVTDSQQVIDYVSEYYNRYGGLVEPNSHLTIDHWIAYLHVAQNQQLVRGALNIADKYSPEFQNYRQHFEQHIETPGEDAISSNSNKKPYDIPVQLASVTRSLKENSDDIYDDILNAMSYQLSDRDLCCMVSIMGSIGDTKLMKTLANILRILAVDLSAEITRIQNLARRILANFMQDAMFELVSQISDLQFKILDKLTKAFTVEFKDLEACGGLLTIGWALLRSTNILFNKVKSMLTEITAAISDFGLPNEGSWKIAADRRHLLGIARILEVLSFRLDAANVCDGFNPRGTSPDQIDSIETNPGQAIFTLIQNLPENIQISDSDVQKYFSHIEPQTSSALKFTYGIKSQQNPETKNTRCSESESAQKIESMVTNLSEAMKSVFNE